jgi:hypothetical protein
MHAAIEGYLRGLATEMNESTNAIRKELNNLAEAGLIVRHEDEQRITYQANPSHPFFGLIQQMVRKYLGLDTLVEQVLHRLGDVRRVILVGDYAQGIDSGSIEVVVEGEAINVDYITKLAHKISQEIQKQVHIAPVQQFEGVGVVIFEQE